MQQRALFKKNGILKECFGKTCFGAEWKGFPLWATVPEPGCREKEADLNVTQIIMIK